MKKILIGIVAILLFARLADKFLFGDNNSSEVKYTPSSQPDEEYTYDCMKHKKYFINGHCQKCFAEEATKPMRDRLNHY